MGLNVKYCQKQFPDMIVSNRKYICFFGYGLLLLMVMGFSVITNISDSREGSDGLSNLIAAHNLYKYGVNTYTGAKESGEKPIVTTRREPFPPFVTAVYMMLDPKIEKTWTYEDLKVGENIRRIRYVNLFWYSGAVLGVYVSTYYLCHRITLACFAMALSGIILNDVALVDRLYTELPAACLIIWVSLFSYLCVIEKHYKYFVLLGVLLAALILTKGVFLYVAFGVFGFLFVAMVCCLRGFGGGWRLGYLAFSVFICFSIVGSWMFRNHYHTGRFELSNAGGIVLYKRALLNQMTMDEYKGSFGMWGPYEWRRCFGVSKLDTQKGGKLSRLNRKSSDFRENDKESSRQGHWRDTISFFQTANAKVRYLQLEHIKSGSKYWDAFALACDDLKHEAIASIKGDVLSHVTTTIPLFWRGVWFVRVGDWVSGTLLGFCIRMFNVAIVLVFWGALIVGLCRFRFDRLAFMIVSIGGSMFYLLVSHNLPRYQSVFSPVMVVVFVCAMTSLLNKVFERNLSK